MKAKTFWSGRNIEETPCLRNTMQVELGICVVPTTPSHHPFLYQTAIIAVCVYFLVDFDHNTHLHRPTYTLACMKVNGWSDTLTCLTSHEINTMQVELGICVVPTTPSHHPFLYQTAIIAVCVYFLVDFDHNTHLHRPTYTLACTKVNGWSDTLTCLTSREIKLLSCFSQCRVNWCDYITDPLST